MNRSEAMTNMRNGKHCLDGNKNEWQYIDGCYLKLTACEKWECHYTEFLSSENDENWRVKRNTVQKTKWVNVNNDLKVIGNNRLYNSEKEAGSLSHDWEHTCPVLVQEDVDE